MSEMALSERMAARRFTAAYNSTAMDQQPQQMACMEVWGGSQLTDRTVEFSGLDAWVYSRPYAEAPRGGDVVYVSSCATGRITRLLLADVAGHGADVASTAADLRLLMRRFVNTLDQTELVRRLNKRFTALQRDAVFATAIVTTFFAPTGRLVISNAGHPRPFVYRAGRGEWQLLQNDDIAREKGPRNLPLGILSLSEYDQLDVELSEGDCLLVYTDAFTEAQDASGDVLGEDGFHRILTLLGRVPPERFVQTLVDEVGQRYPGNLATDDATVLFVRANGRQMHYSFWDRLRAFGRFALTVVRSLNPSSERAPVPDFHVANVGGAVVPALGQRWRKPTGS